LDLFKKHISIFMFLCIFCIGGQSFAQFYSSPNVCVSNKVVDPISGIASGCSESTIFFDELPTATSWEWNFGDGSPMVTTRSASHNFQTVGTYTVTLNRPTGPGSGTPTTKTVTVGSYPQQPMFNKKEVADTTVCGGKTLKLDPYKGNLLSGSGNYRYLWFPNGETTPTISVESSGCYSVQVFDGNSNCSLTARINVKFCLQSPPSGNEPQKWYFGFGSTLEFSQTGTVIPRDSTASTGDFLLIPGITDPVFNASGSTTSNPLNLQGAAGMVYGPDGRLAFASDGKKIFSGLDDSEILMEDGSVYPGLTSVPSQGVVIVPKNSCNECQHHQYYLFTVNPTNGLLSYSIIDTRFNDKKGAIVATNIPVVMPVEERISVTPNADETGFVLYANSLDGSGFQTITIDSNGVSVVPQAVGNTPDPGYVASGQATVSPNNRLMARGTVIGNKNYVEIFDIDANTSQLLNPRLIDIGVDAPPTIYGVAFSNNSDVLYVSVSGDPLLGQESQLIQLNLLAGTEADITAELKIIDRSSVYQFGAVQLGPIGGDGSKLIYLSILDQNFVPYIQRPDLLGDPATIGYSNTPASATKGITVFGTTKLGLPTVVKAVPQQESDGLSASYDGNCYKSPTILTVNPICDPLKSEFTWMFEDGSEQKGEQISYTFPKLGWNTFKIKVVIFNKSPLEKIVNNKTINSLLETECLERIFVDSIYIKPSPILKLPPFEYLCVVEGERKLIGPATVGGKGFEYDWQTSVGTSLNSPDSAYNFALPGLYLLDVENDLGCLTSSKITILEGCEPRIFIPDAFTPNGDAINDLLDIHDAHIIEPELQIFNRWGEVVFTTDNLDIRWDGKFKGQYFGNQLYTYTLKYKSRYFPERGILTARGSVIVLH
jgi:gliding motility-associated-like protein